MYSKIKKVLNVVSMAAATLSIGAGMAHAADDFTFGGFSKACYTQAAVTMTPQDDAVQNDIVHMTHERVYHNDGTTGNILLFGEVHPWIEMYGDGVSFAMNYKDPDGRGTESTVTAELRFVGPQGIQILSKLSSNDSARVTNEVQKMRTSFDWSLLNRNDGYYMVRVNVSRTNPAYTPAALSYSMCSAIF